MKNPLNPYLDLEPGHDHEHSHACCDHGGETVSRRSMLKAGAGAALAGATAVTGAGSVMAQQGQGPAVITGWRPETEGMVFKALVRDPRSTNPASIVDVRMNAIDPFQVVLKVQATQACYTIVGDLDPDNLQTIKAGTALTDMPYALGHGAVGIVEEVGPMVKRVKKGDYAMLALGGTCGQCYNCLRGRANSCHSGSERPPVVVGTLSDGSPVGGNLAGCAEYIVGWEESIVPVFSNVPAVELASLTCPMACGLGMAMVRSPVDFGSTVAVFGAGPIGLSAVMGAKLMGAGQIIVVEPIRYRRELALQNGATDLVDPNDFSSGTDMNNYIRSLVGNFESDRPFAGGRRANTRAPDFIIEAIGGEKFPPRVERYAREPHGVEALQNVFDLCPIGGLMRTSGHGYRDDMRLDFWAGAWANGSKHHEGGNMAGLNTLRELPRWMRMMENGQINGSALVGTVSSLENWREAFEAAAYRTAITGIITPHGPEWGPVTPTTA